MEFRVGLSMENKCPTLRVQLYVLGIEPIESYSIGMGLEPLVLF